MTITMRVFDFDNEPVRATMIDGEPWFVGRDVCRILGIDNESQALSRLDDDERRDGVCIIDPIGRQQTPILISEPGVYNLVFTSRSEIAKRFKRWLAHEVLPALRKTGLYNMAAEEAEPIDMQTDGRDLEPVDFDRIPTGHVRLAISLLREVRIVFGIPHARLVARHIGVTSTVLRLDQYREIGESVDDDIASFGRDRLIAVDKATATAADIYKSYVKWCRNNEIAPASQTMLGRRLRLMGFNKQQSSGTVRYLGVALSDAAE